MQRSESKLLIMEQAARALSPPLFLVAQSRQWVSLDIPFTNFAGLSNRAKLYQIIFVDENSTIPSFYVDNVYLYNAVEHSLLRPLRLHPRLRFPLEM